MRDSASRMDVVRWLESRKRLLLLSHERPDGDSFGALHGLHLALRAAGRPSIAYQKAPLPSRYRRLFPSSEGICVGAEVPPGDVDGIVCLDVTDWSRVDAPPGWAPDRVPPGICIVDHHIDNRRFGEVCWVDAGMAATCQMLTALIRDGGLPLPPEAATCLLAGIAMDTGGFRFPNTTAAVLRDTAFLMDAGVDYPAAMKALFLSEPYNRRILEARLMQDARFAHERRVIYASLSSRTLEELGLARDDTEGVIDILRSVDGVEIACLIVQEENLTRFSFRSQNRALPVNGIARELGGGGHLLAAGARVPSMPAAEAEARVLALTGKVLAHD